MLNELLSIKRGVFHWKSRPLTPEQYNDIVDFTHTWIRQLQEGNSGGSKLWHEHELLEQLLTRLKSVIGLRFSASTGERLGPNSRSLPERLRPSEPAKPAPPPRPTRLTLPSPPFGSSLEEAKATLERYNQKLKWGLSLSAREKFITSQLEKYFILRELEKAKRAEWDENREDLMDKWKKDCQESERTYEICMAEWEKNRKQWENDCEKWEADCEIAKDLNLQRAEETKKALGELSLKMINIDDLLNTIRELTESMPKLPIPITVPFEAVSWELLPGGDRLAAEVNAYIKKTQHKYKSRRLDESRIRNIMKLSPVRCAAGKEEFDGYMAFFFEGCSNAVLECAWEGNAIYIFPENKWSSLSKLTKSELIESHQRELTRIIHDPNELWFRRLKRMVNKKTSQVSKSNSPGRPHEVNAPKQKKKAAKKAAKKKGKTSKIR